MTGADDIGKAVEGLAGAFKDMDFSQKVYPRRLHDHETFDKITLEVVPRYKTSGLSGDEWRTGVEIKLWFKGQVVATDFRTSMDAALRYLPTIMDAAACPVSGEWLKIEEKTCDQPGCAEPWIARYKLKKLTSERGEYLAEREHHFAYYRKFCKKHLRRGDCSREDADDNYEPMDGIGPDDGGLVIESPSQLAGIVEVGKALPGDDQGTVQEP